MNLIHNVDCSTDIRRVEGKAYMELFWKCVDECPIGGKGGV